MLRPFRERGMQKPREVGVGIDEHLVLGGVFSAAGVRGGPAKANAPLATGGGRWRRRGGKPAQCSCT